MKKGSGDNSWMVETLEELIRVHGAKTGYLEEVIMKHDKLILDLHKRVKKLEKTDV